MRTHRLNLPPSQAAPRPDVKLGAGFGCAMNDLQSKNFAAIIALSETMLQCAEQGDWLQLAGLESQRRALIEKHMTQASVNETQGAYAEAARRILALDERTMSLALAGRSSIAKQIQTFNIGRSAVHAYAQQLP